MKIFTKSAIALAIIASPVGAYADSISGVTAPSAVNQSTGTSGYEKITDGTNGPAAVKPAGTPVSPSADPVLAVSEPDDLSIMPASVSSATTIFCQDMQGYQSASVEVLANASANTLTFEATDDSTNGCSSTYFTTITGMAGNSNGSNSPIQTTAATSSYIIQFPKKGRYFRVRVSTYVSGSITVAAVFSRQSTIAAIGAPSLISSTSIIGNVAQAPYNTTQTAVSASSGNVANASAAASLAAVASKTNYVTAIEITGAGATAGSCVNATLAGLLGGTSTYTFCAPTGVAIAGAPIIQHFNPPLPASAVNTALTLTLPALGSGNTNAAVSIHGYYQ